MLEKKIISSLQINVKNSTQIGGKYICGHGLVFVYFYEHNTLVFFVIIFDSNVGYLISAVTNT